EDQWALAEHSQTVGDVAGATARDPAQLVQEKRNGQPLHLVRNQVLEKPSRELHEVVERNRTGDDDPPGTRTSRRGRRSSPNGFLAAPAGSRAPGQRYLPTIGFSRSLVSSGITFGSVKTPWRIALRQLQLLFGSTLPAAPRMARRAAVAFSDKIARMTSTDTASVSSRQQS